MPGKKGKFTAYTDEQLMLFVCDGEVQAFDELYYRYSPGLMGYFKRMLNYDNGLAEDALQDLFLKIAEHPEKFDGGRSFKTWVYSVASNSCKNFYRHRQVVNSGHDEIQFMTLQVNDRSFLEAAKRIDGAIFMKMLDEVLEEVPPQKKEAFILKYQEERTIAEIAFIQECPEGSVKSRLHYTIKLLEEKLQIFNPLI